MLVYIIICKYILLYVSIYYYMLIYIIICQYILLYVSIHYYMSVYIIICRYKTVILFTGRRQGVYNLSSVFKSESAASGITNDLHDLDMVKKGNKSSGCDKLKALGIDTNCSTKKELSRTVSVAKLVNELVDPQETASRAEVKVHSHS